MKIVKQSDYAQRWAINSKKLFEEKFYEWMVNHIENYSGILEIGCGAGYGTLSIVKSKHKVFALDKNEHCILATKNLLEAHGYSVEIITSYAPVTKCADAYLITFDMIMDESYLGLLSSFINNYLNFEVNAIAFWLPGGIINQFNNNIVDALITMENRIFYLAKRLTDSFQAISYIDRTDSKSIDEKRSEMIECNNENNTFFKAVSFISITCDTSVEGGVPITPLKDNGIPKLIAALYEK